MRGEWYYALRRPAEAGSAIANGRFFKDIFRYDAEANAYHCPGGRKLDISYRAVTRGHANLQYSNPAACSDCAIKVNCTSSCWRRINHWENEAVLERMAKRLAVRPDILGVRREMVEHPFGSIKQWMNQGAFLTRKLENVRAEFSLTALAYNFRRAITIVGISGMIRAVQA